MQEKSLLSIVINYWYYAINTSYLDDINIRKMMTVMVKGYFAR